MLKLQTKDGKWVIIDGDRTIVFDCSRDAWTYIFLMRKIRPRVNMGQGSLYPVENLVPKPKIIKKIIVKGDVHNEGYQNQEACS